MHYIDYFERKQLYKYKNIIYRKVKDKLIDYANEKFIKQEISKDILVNGYYLDKEQKKAIVTNEINNLVVAGAGSGKSLTIIGKVNYLLNLGVRASEILCISFTNDACNSLKKKLYSNIEVLTFHKLALKIIKCDNYSICSSNYLNYVVDEYFNGIIYHNDEMIKRIVNIINPSIKDNFNNKYEQMKDSNDLTNLKKIIVAFINLYKENNYNIEHFLKIDKKQYHDILSIILDIYYLYNNDLTSQGLIDFDDMIVLATNKINQNKYRLRYKYIIIDEFQDTSLVKAELIRAIIKKTKAKLFVVGDDFQSIYKFTGCNLDIFVNFSKYFGYSKVSKITTTYRNSQELINVASKFILKNKYQIKKKMKSSKCNKRPIKVINEKSNILEKVIKYLIKKEVKEVMILGRNNNDIYSYLNYNFKYDNGVINYKKYDISIKYLTVHRSKGLESECVVVINLYDDILGFPCKLKNADVLNLIDNEEKYMYEEERRLFYVCLTRTKKDIYLICPLNMSVFVQEIINDSKRYIEFLDI